jgi:hypothetical protein
MPLALVVTTRSKPLPYYQSCYYSITWNARDSRVIVYCLVRIDESLPSRLRSRFSVYTHTSSGHLIKGTTASQLLLTTQSAVDDIELYRNK